MKKLVVPLMLLLAFALLPSTLRAQDNCSLIAVDGCDDTGPFDVGTWTYCEYRIRSDGSEVPITNDPVTWGQQSRVGTGWHQHLGNFFGRPLLDIVQDIENTGMDGCNSVEVFGNEYAGVHVLNAKGSQSTTGGASRLVSLHWYGPDGNPDQLTPLPLTGSLNQRYDAYHTYTPGQIRQNYLTTNAVAKFVNLANVYEISAGQALEVVRCGLPEGGTADNDAGSFLISIPGSWTTRLWELHDNMQACDVVNHSLDGDDPNGTRFQALLSAMALPAINCALGAFQPDQGSGAPMSPAQSRAFWGNQLNVHVECASNPLKVPPPGRTQ